MKIASTANAASGISTAATYRPTCQSLMLLIASRPSVVAGAVRQTLGRRPVRGAARIPRRSPIRLDPGAVIGRSPESPHVAHVNRGLGLDRGIWHSSRGFARPWWTGPDRSTWPRRRRANSARPTSTVADSVVEPHCLPITSARLAGMIPRIFNRSFTDYSRCDGRMVSRATSPLETEQSDLASRGGRRYIDLASPLPPACESSFA